MWSQLLQADLNIPRGKQGFLGPNCVTWVKANKAAKVGIKNKRLKAGWDLAYCELVLKG